MLSKEKILKAKTNEYELNLLLKEYKTFIYSTASKFSKKFVDDSSEESSVAILAFYEAIKKFNPKYDNFITFATGIIRNRIIDYLRKENKNNSIPFSVICEDDDGKIIRDFESRNFTVIESPVRLEIDELTDILKKYGISFLDISKCSPKSKKTKEEALILLRYLFSHREFLKEMLKSGKLSILQMEADTKIKRKKIERLRKYLFVCAEIINGDFPCLIEYIPNGKELIKCRE